LLIFKGIKRVTTKDAARNSTVGLMKETTDIVTKAENLSAYIRNRDDYIYTKERSNACRLLNTLHSKYMQDKDKFINTLMSMEQEDINPNSHNFSKRYFTSHLFSDAIARVYTQVKLDDVINLFDIIKEDHSAQACAADMWCFCCLVKRFNSRNINENGTNFTYVSNKFWKRNHENSSINLLNGCVNAESSGSDDYLGKQVLGTLAREKKKKDDQLWGEQGDCEIDASSDVAPYIKYWHDTSLPQKVSDNNKKHVGSTILSQRDNCSAATAIHVLSEIRDIPTPKTCRGTLKVELIKTNNIKVPSIDIPPPPTVDDSILCYLETPIAADVGPKSYRHVKNEGKFCDNKGISIHPKGLKSFDITMNELNKASASDCLHGGSKSSQVNLSPKRLHHTPAVQEMLVGENKKPMDIILFGKPLSSDQVKKTNKRYVHTNNPKATIGSLLGNPCDIPRAMSPIKKSHNLLIEKSFESMRNALILEPAMKSC